MTTGNTDVERAEALLDMGRYDDGVALLAKRVAEDPDDVRAWTSMARGHLDADRPDEAVEATEEALRRAPEYVYALLVHARALQQVGRPPAAEQALREVIRIDPEFWLGYARLANIAWRNAVILNSAGRIGKPVTPDEMRNLTQESTALAKEAIRLAPDEVFAYEVALTLAKYGHSGEDVGEIERAILRLDPTHAEALESQTAKAAETDEVLASQASTMYADALAVAPDSRELRSGLDRATYRLLRGTRWLALLCLVIAGVVIDLFHVDGEVQRTLPVPLGSRLWVLVPMAAVWAFGAWRIYRRLRTGVRLNVGSLLRRQLWARIVVAQAGLTTLCALLIAEIPWTGRGIPQFLFWTGLVVPWLTINSDRKLVK